MSEAKLCSRNDCHRPARMALTVVRPTADNVYIKVWTDERPAAVPKKADLYCKAHGEAVVQSLIETLVNHDDEDTEQVQPEQGREGYLRRMVCPVCNAQPGYPCTQATDNGRRPVSWYHGKRQDAAVHQ